MAADGETIMGELTAFLNAFPFSHTINIHTVITDAFNALHLVILSKRLKTETKLRAFEENRNYLWLENLVPLQNSIQFDRSELRCCVLQFTLKRFASVDFFPELVFRHLLELTLLAQRHFFLRSLIHKW